MKRLLLAGVVASAGVSAPFACTGGEEPKVPEQSVSTASALPGTVQAPPGPAAPSAHAGNVPPPPGLSPAPVPVATGPTTAGSGPPPAPTEHPMQPAVNQTAQSVLNELAKSHIMPGAVPAGQVRVGYLSANQRYEQVVNLEPNKCYTVVAAGLLPVAEVNIQIIPATGVPGVQPVLAADQTTGPHAVLGKAPNCFKWPLPTAGAARLVTQVSAGQGIVATQVYGK